MKARLRAMEPGDVDILYKWENDPDIWGASSTLAPYSRFVLEQYIADSLGKDVFEAGQLRLIIEQEPGGKPVGTIDLSDICIRDLRGSIGIAINEKQCRGRGIASSALRQFVSHCFRVLGLHSLSATIDEDNEPSIRLFLKCGFCRCGMLRQSHRTPQGWKSQVLMQIVSGQQDLAASSPSQNS